MIGVPWASSAQMKLSLDVLQHVAEVD